MEQNKELGNRIKQIRLNLGKSQEEFGRLFDPPAPKSAVSRWEHGGNPNKTRLKKISELGHIPLNELIHGSLFNAVNNMANLLYNEFFNYEEHMSKDGNDVRTYAVECAQRNTNSRLRYEDMGEFFSYVSLAIYDKNLDDIFDYYVSYVYKEAVLQHINPSDSISILRIFVDVAKRHTVGYERDNAGLIDSTIENLSELSSEVNSFVYGVDREKAHQYFNDPSRPINYYVELPNSIDKSLFKDIQNAIANTEKEIKKIAKKYNIKSKQIKF